MYPDFKDLLSAFNAHQIKYLIVGGYAVSFHAQPRATKDLDVLVRADPENGRALYAALAQFGAPLQGVSAHDLTEPISSRILEHRCGEPRARRPWARTLSRRRSGPLSAAHQWRERHAAAAN